MFPLRRLHACGRIHPIVALFFAAAIPATAALLLLLPGRRDAGEVVAFELQDSDRVLFPIENIVVADGRAITMSSGHVQVWDLETERELRHFAIGNNAATSVAADGSMAAAGVGDVVTIWDVETGEVIRRLEGHPGGALSAAFSHDGHLLAISSAGRASASRRGRAAAGGPQQSADNDDAARDRTDAPTDAPQNASANPQPASDSDSPSAAPEPPPPAPPAVHVWDLETSDERAHLVAPVHPVLCLEFTPDGSRLLAGSGNVLAQGPSEGSLYLWETAGGALVRRISAHQGAVCAVAFLGEGQRALSSSFDGSCLWNLTTGEQLRRLRQPGLLWCAASSPDGRRAVSGGQDGTVRLWDPESGEELARTEGYVGVTAVVFESADRVLFGTVEGRLFRWQLPDV